MKSGISKLSTGMFLTLAIVAIAGAAVSSADAGGGGYSRGGSNRGGHGHGGGSHGGHKGGHHGGHNHRHGGSHGRHYGGGSSISFSFSSGGFYGSSVSIGSGWCAPRYYPRPIAYCPPPVYYRPAPVVYIPPTPIYIESAPRTVVIERPVVRETVYVDRPVTVETRVENRTIQTIRDDGSRVTVPSQTPATGSDIPTDAVKPQGYTPSRQLSPSNNSVNSSPARLASRDVYQQLQASTAAAGTSVTKGASVARPTAAAAVAMAKQTGNSVTILPAATTKIQPAQPTRVAKANTTTTRK